MTILEFVGKCVPVIDQMVDSVEVFVVPWIVRESIYTVWCVCALLQKCHQLTLCVCSIYSIDGTTT